MPSRTIATIAQTNPARITTIARDESIVLGGSLIARRVQHEDTTLGGQRGTVGRLPAKLRGFPSAGVSRGIPIRFRLPTVEAVVVRHRTRSHVHLRLIRTLG
jgi:hypothetical protein